MAGTLKFTDTIKFSLLDPNLIKIKDHYEGAFKPGGVGTPGATHPSGLGTVAGAPGEIQPAQTQLAAPQAPGLQIRISATHAGIITGNNGFYLPDRMKKGTSTFTDNFGKPVLLHHEAKQDAVGRITEAHYVDTSGAVIDQFKDMIVKDKYGKQVGVINEVLINDFCSGRMPYGMAVDTVRTIFRDSILDDETYDGLGHIQLVANITDSVAIQKLLDGRYLTGSVGASTNSASCSVCRQDWTELGQCEHKPGGIYDGAKCFIIAGDLRYSEYSFVNKPADRHSRVLELNYNGIQDSIQLENEYEGRVYEVQLQFPQYDSITTKEEEGMKTEPKENKGGEVELQDSATEETQVDATAAAESTETSSEVADATSADATAGTESAEAGAEGGKETPVNDNTEEETVESLMIKVLDEEEGFEFTDEVEEKLYALLWDEVLAAVNDGDLIIEAAVLKDAKLSTASRKKLPKSSFCGPNRSFPVHDCAHVTAARRLIGRAKVSDSAKSTILACVSRKSKAMGCGGTASTKDAVQEVTNIQNDLNHSRVLRMVLSLLDEDIYFSDESVLVEEEKKMLQTIIKRMAGFVGKDSFNEAASAEGLGLSDSVEQTYVDEVAKHEEVIGDLRDRLEANRKEYSELLQDYHEVQDSLVEATSNVRKEKEGNLSTLRSLRDGKIEEHNFSEISDTDLQSEIDQALKSVDMNKITDKLGDGMSRSPEGEVDSPTDVQDNTNSNNQKSKLDVEDLKRIEDAYWEIRIGRGEYAAESFLAKMKSQNRLPQEG